MRRVVLFLAASVTVVSAIGLWAQEADLVVPAINPPAASQPVPRLIMLSGALKDLTGKPLTGPVDLNFAVYKEQTDAAPLWQESQTLNVDEQGHYTALLGAMQPEGLPVDLFTSGEARWLGVSVGRLPEQPRVLLVSVPYALKANDAEMLGGKPASAYMLAPQAESTTSQGPGTAGATAPRGAAASELATPGKPKSGPKPNVVGTGTQNYIPLWTDSAGTLGNSVMFQSSGLVGVGTATPGAALDVHGASAGLRLSGTGTHQLTVTGATSGRLGQDSSGFFFSSDTNGAAIRFGTNNGSGHEWMRITSAGNIGIATTAPAQKLDVAGNINSSGNVTATGSVTAASFTGSGAGLTSLHATSLTGALVTSNLPAAARTRAITYLAGCDNCGLLQSTDGQRQFYVNLVGAMTIASVTCFSDAGGSTINIARDNGGPTNLLSSNLTCSTTGATTTSFASSALNLNDQLDFVMETADGVARRATVVIQAVLN